MLEVTSPGDLVITLSVGVVCVGRRRLLEVEDPRRVRKSHPQGEREHPTRSFRGASLVSPSPPSFFIARAGSEFVLSRL